MHIGPSTMHIGPVAALIRQWPVISGSFHRPGRHSISVPTFGGWSTDAGRSPDSRWTHQAWAALSPSERKPWEYPGLPRLQPEIGKALDRLVEFYGTRRRPCHTTAGPLPFDSCW